MIQMQTQPETECNECMVNYLGTTYITVKMRPQKSLTGNAERERETDMHLYLADTFECNAVIHQLNAAFIELSIYILQA